MYPGLEFSWTILTRTEKHSYQIFYFFIEVPLTQNIHHSAHILLFTYSMYLQIQLDHFEPREGAVFVQQLRTEKQTGNVASAQNSVQGPLCQDNSNNMWQLQGTVILGTNCLHIYVLKYIFLSSKILCISLYIIAWKVRNLNKSNVLTTTECFNWTLKKKVDNIILKISVQYLQFCKSRKFFCSIIQGLKEKKASSETSQVLHLL
jgi:hypothetical protein